MYKEQFISKDNFETEIIYNMNIITWNMQGSSATTENKWNTGVKPLLGSMEPTPVLCLQECGGVPESAMLIQTLTFAVDVGVTDTVTVYAWGGTSSRPAYFIFFHCWDTEGNRVNTAVVTNSLPLDLSTSVALILPKGSKVWRPALGVCCDDTWVFSFHAISPGGPDGADLLTAVSDNYATWIVGADWNRQPDTLAVPGGSVLCPPANNTYSVKDAIVKYDYCVRSGDFGGTGTVITAVVLSDHYPVSFAI